MVKIFGMQGEYVEVLINDSYTGLYLLTHPIDRKQLGLSANAGNDTLPERLYKKKYAAAWQESDFLGGLPDLNQIDYRGGFYLKGNQVLGTEEEWEPLRRLAACIEADDKTFSRQIGQLVNLSNLVDNWLFFRQSVDSITVIKMCTMQHGTKMEITEVILSRGI